MRWSYIKEETYWLAFMDLAMALVACISRQHSDWVLISRIDDFQTRYIGMEASTSAT